MIYDTGKVNNSKPVSTVLSHCEPQAALVIQQNGMAKVLAVKDKIKHSVSRCARERATLHLLNTTVYSAVQRPG